jgi:hypothetical protein
MIYFRNYQPKANLTQRINDYAKSLWWCKIRSTFTAQLGHPQRTTKR